MTHVLLLALPAVALAYLAAVGAGVTTVLAARCPPDAQAALAPVVGAAILAAASVLLPLGVPARALALAVGGAGAAVTVVRRARVALALRKGAPALLVALLAIGLAGAPSVARGDWRATTLYGSTDSYHWSSQARAYLDGPAERPASEHPDRVTYERSRTQHWAVALPFGLLQLAWLADSDPADIYGAFAAVVFCLLPLAVFAAARTCLGWRRRFAAAAALALVANASLLFASHFSWQQQLAGTAFAFAAAASLYLALERGAPRRETVLAAFLAAAALATYRMGFAPYLAALLATVFAARAAQARRGAGELRRLGRAAAGFAVVFLSLAVPSVVAVLRGFPDFYSSGGFSTAFKRAFPEGQLAEAIGLVPRVWSVKGSWPAAVEVAWLAVASLAAAVLLVAGFRAARRAPRTRFLTAGAALAVAGYAVLLLPTFSAYLSFKLLSYAAPFLVLLALMPFVLSRARVQLAGAVAVGALVLPSASVATVAAIEDAKTPGPLATLPAAAASLPRDAVIAVALDDPWRQAWALYYLREQRVSVERPSYLLTAQGDARPHTTFRHRPVAYVLGAGARGEVVWRAEDLALARAA